MKTTAGRFSMLGRPMLSLQLETYVGVLRWRFAKRISRSLAEWRTVVTRRGTFQRSRNATHELART